jgi:hypothetical protein
VEGVELLIYIRGALNVLLVVNDPTFLYRWVYLGRTTTNEEELDEANSDQVLSERRADSGISLELNDEFLLLFLSCLAIVAVGLIIRKSFLQKEK